MQSVGGTGGQTRMTISGTRTPTVAEEKATGKLVTGVSKLLIVLGDIVLGRAGRKIRRPTDAQMSEFSSAIGEVLARRVDIAKLGPDIMALTTAGGAFGDWASDGPLTYAKTPSVDHVGYVPPEPDPFTVEPQAPQFADLPKTSTIVDAPAVKFLD